MDILVLGTQWETVQWQLALEDASESWRCCAATSYAAATRALSRPFDALILCPGTASEALLRALYAAPPITAPWLIGDGWHHPQLDATLCPAQSGMLSALFARPALPQLSRACLPRLLPLAREQLRALGMPSRLGAWVFLPRMAAMCVVHPSLLTAVTRRLYPLCAAAHGLTAACVERRLRLAVESTWNNSSLDALERFFGQTIDPQRGKPTNREFLARLQVCLTQEALRACDAKEQLIPVGQPLLRAADGAYSSSIQSIYSP